CTAPVVGGFHLVRSSYRTGIVAWRKCCRAELEYFICFLVVGATVGIALFFLIAPTPVRLGPSAQSPVAAAGDHPLARYRPIWLCLVGFVFAIFAFRSFCWLFYFEGGNIDILSLFNLGDFVLHL